MTLPLIQVEVEVVHPDHLLVAQVEEVEVPVDRPAALQVEAVRLVDQAEVVRGEAEAPRLDLHPVSRVDRDQVIITHRVENRVDHLQAVGDRLHILVIHGI